MSYITVDRYIANPQRNQLSCFLMLFSKLERVSMKIALYEKYIKPIISAMKNIIYVSFVTVFVIC